MALFSIGYATKPIECYLQQLQDAQITAVADVRSVPYSKVFHDYHQEALRQALRQQGIHYVYLGDSLGPRSKDDAHYNAEQQVQFDRLSQSALFAQGVERLGKGLAQGHRIALTCAEKEPAVCHRSLLLGYALLRQQQLDVQHIHHDGHYEGQQALEARLMTLTGIETDMFTDHATAQARAYQAQCQRYAYRRPTA